MIENINRFRKDLKWIIIIVLLFGIWLNTKKIGEWQIQTAQLTDEVSIRQKESNDYLMDILQNTEILGDIEANTAGY